MCCRFIATSSASRVRARLGSSVANQSLPPVQQLLSESCCTCIRNLRETRLTFLSPYTGPWWYAAGATCVPFVLDGNARSLPSSYSVQILLFAQNAAKLKQNSPNAHTFLEVISKRWGRVAHFTFLFFGLSTNLIVSSMLMTGKSPLRSTIRNQR